MPIPKTNQIKALFEALFVTDYPKLEAAVNAGINRANQQNINFVDGKPQNIQLITMFGREGAAYEEVRPDRSDVEEKMWQLVFLTAASFKGGKTRSKYTNRNLLIHLIEKTEIGSLG